MQPQSFLHDAQRLRQLARVRKRRPSTRQNGIDFVHDIAPIASTVRLPNVLQVSPSVPVTTVPELIAYAKANPQALSVASAGNGTSGHLSAELFKSMTGVDMNERGQLALLEDIRAFAAEMDFALDPTSGDPAAYYLRNVVPQWSLATIYRGMSDYMVIQVIVLALLLLFPQIALWLPSAVR